MVVQWHGFTGAGVYSGMGGGKQEQGQRFTGAVTEVYRSRGMGLQGQGHGFTGAWPSRGMGLQGHAPVRAWVFRAWEGA